VIVITVAVWLCGAALMAAVFVIDNACREIPGALKPLLIAVWPGTVVAGMLLVLFGWIAERGRR